MHVVIPACCITSRNLKSTSTKINIKGIRLRWENAKQRASEENCSKKEHGTQGFTTWFIRKLQEQTLRYLICAE